MYRGLGDYGEGKSQFEDGRDSAVALGAAMLYALGIFAIVVGLIIWWLF